MKLYEIAKDYRVLMEAIEAGDIPEECIEDTLESVESSFIDKVDNIACLLKTLDAEIRAFKAEEDRLAGRRAVKQKAYDRLKEYLSKHIQEVGYDKVETTRNIISFRKSEEVIVSDEGQFLTWAVLNRSDLIKFGEPAAKKSAIKEAIKGGESVPFAQLITNNNIQIK